MDNLNEIKETLKDMFKAAITNAKDGDEKGEWITINGTHVFIPEGKTAEDVIKEKGWKEKGENKADNPSEGKKEKKNTYTWQPSEVEMDGGPIESHYTGTEEYKNAVYKWAKPKNKSLPQMEYSPDLDTFKQNMDKWLNADQPSSLKLKIRKEYLRHLDETSSYKNYKDFYQDKADNSIKNGLSEIIKNCKPETKEDLKILKGLKDILEEQ